MHEGRRRQHVMNTGASMLALVLALSTMALPAFAGDKHDRQGRESPANPREPPRDQRQPGVAISMDRAIEIVERRYRARVVKADVTEVNGRRIYVLRLLSDEGRVWKVRVDAVSGGIL